MPIATTCSPGKLERAAFPQYWPFPASPCRRAVNQKDKEFVVGLFGSANRFRTQCRLVNSLIPLSPPEKGHIAFGMVAFPEKLHAAARSQTVSFNQLHQCDHSRVKQVLYWRRPLLE